MANRVLPGQERILPLLTFRIPIEVCFSVGTTEKRADKVVEDISNLNLDFSCVCRDLLYKDLGIKTKRDVEIFFNKQINSAKNEVYEKLNINRQKSFGNHIVLGLEKFIKKKQNGK